MNQVSLSYQLDLGDRSIWITATPSQTAKSELAYVQELGDFIAGRNYFTRRANLPSYLIKYCISGEGILEYDGNVYSVKPGQLFWIDCEKPQYYKPRLRKESGAFFGCIFTDKPQKRITSCSLRKMAALR